MKYNVIQAAAHCQIYIFFFQNLSGGISECRAVSWHLVNQLSELHTGRLKKKPGPSHSENLSKSHIEIFVL